MDALVAALENALAEIREARERALFLQERMRQVLETASDAFLSVDEDGIAVEWNATAERTFGWTREEVLGRPLADTVVPPAARELFLGNLRRYRETGETSLVGRRVETSVLHRDGHFVPVEVTAWPFTSGSRPIFSALVRDLTERRRGEEARERLAAIVESSEDAIIGKDLDGVVLSWNRGAGVIYGYAAEEMIGRSVFVLVPEDRYDEMRDILGRVRRGESVRHLETVHCGRGGQLIDVAVTVSPVRDPAGAVVGASTIARDITEQRWMAATLDRTLSALSGALEEAREAEERSRRFLADAAHQLRRPVAGMQAASETLLRGLPARKQEQLLYHLAREASRASRLINDLLRVARLDQGEKLELTKCDVVALARSEVDRAQVLAPSLHLAVDTDDGSIVLDADENALREALDNLLDNACRHARSRVGVGIAIQGRTVEMRVTDDGPGVPEPLRDRVFERFASLDARGGAGLGLAIARAAARAHGGDLTCEDGGFVLRLPLAQCAEDGRGADDPIFT